MSYSIGNFRKVKEMLEKRRESAQALSRERLDGLHAKYPEIRAIDIELAKTGMKIFGEVSRGRESIDERIDRIRLENSGLNAKRSALLAKYGFPQNYTDVLYTCEKCGDTGYCGIKMCGCMKRELSLACVESSGLGGLVRTQSFENFDLNYYSGEARTLAEMNFLRCVDYADNFSDTSSGNLLLYGDTGLGKTHMSTSIASVVIDKGFDVVYESAQNLFSAFEAERFGRGQQTDTSKYLECDLLIIDDLGTENSNQFTASCLYNVVNSRNITGRSTIINTNLTFEEMRRKYNDRIASRLFGEFMVLRFLGRDIRMQKISR